MVTLYLDKDVNEITASECNDLLADDSYRIVHAFENEKVRLIITWLGKIVDGDQMFRTTYPLFKAEQYDKLGDKWVESPESGTTFPNLKKVEAYYEDFVIRWTKSYFDEDGNIHEVGNVLAPPEPPKPNDAPEGNYDEMVW